MGFLCYPKIDSEGFTWIVECFFFLGEGFYVSIEFQIFGEEDVLINQASIV